MRWLCPRDKCPHWGQATKYERKCYYQLQCWRGRLAVALTTIRLRFSD